jgi:hypothetical protein
MKKLFYRLPSSRSFIRLLSILTFASISGALTTTNVLATDSSGGSKKCCSKKLSALNCTATNGATLTTVGCHSKCPTNTFLAGENCSVFNGTLLMQDGSIVECKLNVVNSVVEGPPPTVVIAGVEDETITCSKIEDDGDVLTGQANLVESIVFTGVKPDGNCSTNNKLGTSEQRFSAKCGDGTVTGKFQWTSGVETDVDLQGRTFDVGVPSSLSAQECGLLFPGGGAYSKGEIVATLWGYTQKSCQGHVVHSAPFNARYCTAQDLDLPVTCRVNPMDPSSQIDPTHVATVELTEFQTALADVRDKINQTGCPAKGVVKVILSGSDFDFPLSSSSTTSWSCGNPDNLLLAPALSVAFGDFQPFADGITDVEVSCRRCGTGSNSDTPIVSPEGLISVSGLTTGKKQERIVGTAQAVLTSENP